MSSRLNTPGAKSPPVCCAAGSFQRVFGIVNHRAAIVKTPTGTLVKVLVKVCFEQVLQDSLN
jgi:hypothetical protein